MFAWHFVAVPFAKFLENMKGLSMYCIHNYIHMVWKRYKSNMDHKIDKMFEYSMIIEKGIDTMIKYTLKEIKKTIFIYFSGKQVARS